MDGNEIYYAWYLQMTYLLGELQKTDLKRFPRPFSVANAGSVVLEYIKELKERADFSDTVRKCGSVSCPCGGHLPL